MDTFKDTTGTQPTPAVSLHDMIEAEIPMVAIMAARLSIRIGISVTCHLAEALCNEHNTPETHTFMLSNCVSSIMARALPSQIDCITDDDNSIIEFREKCLIYCNQDILRLKKYLENKSFNPTMVAKAINELSSSVENIINEVIEVIINEANEKREASKAATSQKN